MSRPFSYNDENFTVIGNLLFCHFHCTAPIKANTHIVAIPPEIYKRLMFFDNKLFGEYNDGRTVRGSLTISCTVRYDNGNYWFNTVKDFDNQGKLRLWSIYPLKNI